MKKLFTALCALCGIFSFLPVFAAPIIEDDDYDPFIEATQNQQILPTWVITVVIVVASLVAVGIILGIIKNSVERKAKSAK